MASLQGNTIKETYKSLLKVSDNGELEATAQEITDGFGNGTGVSLNTSGDITATGTVSFASLKDSGENITVTKFVDEADGISANDNDTSIPTSAAVKDYVDNNITAQDLDITDGTNTGAVDLDSQLLTFTGDSGVSATVSGQTVTFDSSALQSQITANDGDITALQAADTTLQTNITAEASTRAAADTTLQTNIDTEAATRATADTNLQNQITSNDTDINGLDTRLTTAEANISSNDTDIATNAGNISGLDSRLTTAETNISSNDTDIAALDGRLTTAEGNITSNDTDISGLDTRLTNVEANQSATGVDVTSLEGRMDVVEADIVTIEGDITTLQSSKQSVSEKGQANGYAPLDASAKVPTANLPDSVVGQVQYQGTWNASTDTPTLPSASTVKGHYYVVSTAGTYLTISYAVGDWIISNGTAWEKVDNTDAVTTVFGRLGAIVANESDYSGFYPLISDLNTTNTNVSTNASDITALDGRLTTAEGDITAIETKTNNITVTQAVNLDTMESDIATNASNIASNDTDITNLQTTKYDKTGGTITGSVTANSFVKSGGSANEFLKADGTITILDTELTKLAGIETGADVTDVTNVTTAINSISVTAHSDVTSAGSGDIITAAERTKLQGIETAADVTDVANVTTAINSISVTAHSDVTSAGSGAIITSAERTQLQNAEATYTPSIISTNTSAAIDTLYVITASLTLTLPASPSVGDKIALSNLSGTTTPVVARNGNNIMGLAEDLTIDVANAGIELRYADATNGWVIL